MREAAQAEKRPLTIRSPWRERDPAEAPAGVPHVIRLKAPREGETVIDDQVQGRVVFANKELDDLIILRSDGNPTYNLAVVVDDHDMQVTHVIRGVDHLTNAARQTQIYEAMGWDVPIFAHVPLIHGPDGAKLSKRHGALGIEAYKAMGYLPAALRNYLVRLGWSHGNDEIMSTVADDRLVRHRRHQPLGGALRLRQARGPQRPLHPPRRRPGAAGTASRTCCPICRAARASLRGSTPTCARKFARSPCRASRSGPRRWSSWSNGADFLFADRPLALDDKAQKLLDAEGAPAARRHAAQARGSRPLASASARGDRAHAMPRRPAPSSARSHSRCARRYRQDRIAAGVRRDGRAGPRGSAGPHPRSGRVSSILRALTSASVGILGRP